MHEICKNAKRGRRESFAVERDRKGFKSTYLLLYHFHVEVSDHADFLVDWRPSLGRMSRSDPHPIASKLTHSLYDDRRKLMADSSQSEATKHGQKGDECAESKRNLCDARCLELTRNYFLEHLNYPPLRFLLAPLLCEDQRWINIDYGRPFLLKGNSLKTFRHLDSLFRFEPGRPLTWKMTWNATEARS